MTDLHTTEVQVASNNAPQYKSIAPSILFGLIGAFFQAHNARKRGLTDTRRYWKAAWISTGVSFVVGTILMVLMFVVFIAALGSVSTGVDTTSNEPVATAPAIQPPIVTTVQIGPKADVTPKDMVMQLATIRRDAFCKSGTTGVNLLNQFWAYQGDPQPLGYTLEAASNINELAPTAAHSTYAEDLRQLNDHVQSSVSDCNFAPSPDDLKVALAYTLGPTTRVVATTFVSHGRMYDGYTAVYVQKNGRWYVDQMH